MALYYIVVYDSGKKEIFRTRLTKKGLLNALVKDGFAVKKVRIFKPKQY